MYRESIEELGRFATSYGYPEIEPLLRRAFAASGYTGALRRYVQELEQLHKTKRLYAPTYLATKYLELSDTDRAFYWLQEAYTFRKTRRSQCSTDFYPVAELREMKKESSLQLRPAFSRPPAPHRVPRLSLRRSTSCPCLVPGALCCVRYFVPRASCCPCSPSAAGEAPDTRRRTQHEAQGTARGTQHTARGTDPPL